MIDESRNPHRPEQRVAVITGAARGIGEGIARRLGTDGFKIAVLDLDGAESDRAATSLRNLGIEAIGVGTDVADEDQVTAAVNAVREQLGAVSVLVNNAGILRDNLLFKMSAPDWDQVMNVHLRGAFLMTKAAQSDMVEGRWGRIVNISSSSALGNRGQANYAAAKAGLQGFTKTLAKELGRFGITANAIAPGFIATAMTRATAGRMGITFDELLVRGAANIPVGRAGNPADVAAAASFFARDDAGFVSGQVLYVAGGPLS
jgi:3-oxoacyl-[acyl-carrier protein] reductase